MFTFTPPEARDFNLLGHRGNVVVLFGHNTTTLIALFDFFANEHKFGSHKVSKWHDDGLFRSMARNVRAAPDGGTVIFITDPEAKLPYYVKDEADLVVYGEANGTAKVLKERTPRLGLPRIFRCQGTSSPTGRTFEPSSPAMHSIKPEIGVWGQAVASKGHNLNHYSMGAMVKKPDPCVMCEAGLPLKKSNVRFEGDKPLLSGPTDVEFRIQGGPAPVALLTWEANGALTLNDAQGREFIRVVPEGDAFVRGEKVATSQQDIYEMFRAWVQKMVGPVRLPTPGVPDRQGDVFTKECVDELRKQVDEHGFMPMPKVEFFEHKNDEYGWPKQRVVTKTGHDITNSVENQCLQGVIRDLNAEMSQAARAWEKGLHVGDIMQRLVDVAEGRVAAGSERSQWKLDDKAERMATLSDAVKQLLCDLHPINYAHMAPQWDRFVEVVKKLGIADLDIKTGVLKIQPLGLAKK